MGSTWLQQLAAWWPPGRRGQATALAAAAPAGGAQVLDGLQGSDAAAGQPAKSHLVVMVHGLFGTRDNWRAISELLAQQLDPASTLLFVSHCNERQRTFEGVDVCGERLAEEIRRVAAQHPGLTRISILGHSMGGLISRYAAGRLYDPAAGTMAGLAPCHFVAMATPHLGCDARRNPAQVPLISWLSALPAMGGAVHSVVSELAAPVSELTMGRVGRQFFLSDDEEGGGSPAAPQARAQQPAADARPGGGAGGGGRRRPPLLYRLTQDQPQEGLLFMSALAAFETRTLYANSSGDHLVGWANSSLRRLGELPPKSGRGTGVVREDPLEAAWAPHQRPALHATPAAAALHSGEGRQVSEDAILRARSAGQLAGGSGSGALPAVAAGVEGASQYAAFPAGPAGSSQQQLTVGRQGLAGIMDMEARGQAPAAMGGSPGASRPASLLGQAAAAGERQASGGGVASSSSSGAAVGSSSLGAPSPEEQRVEEMLTRLQALAWRRVDVCFGATLLPLLSHQHIQMQRWWVNWPGRAVVKHLALQIQAMEQLRQPGQQQQQQQHQHQQQQQEAEVAAG